MLQPLIGGDGVVHQAHQGPRILGGQFEPGRQRTVLGDPEDHRFDGGLAGMLAAERFDNDLVGRRVEGVVRVVAEQAIRAEGG